MKKIAIFVASLFILVVAKGQNTHFGVKGGVNISQLEFSDGTKAESKVGIHLGGLAHIHLSKTWAIQPELLYSLEGAKKDINPPVTWNFHYLNVPVLLQYMFENGFRIEGGPQIGFLLDANTKYSNVTVDNNEYESTAISLPIGLGYLMSSGLGLDARYVFGLSNINATKNGNTVHSNVFQLGLFYQFSDTKQHVPR